ncbi:MAG: hypothetical protein ACJ8A0_00500, partial [Microvirga sp.]
RGEAGARIKSERCASSSVTRRIIVGDDARHRRGKRASSSGRIGGGVRFDERKWRFRTDPANARARLDLALSA